MKKRILGVVIVAAVAVAAGWNFNQSKNEAILSDLALANVNALALERSELGEKCGGCSTSQQYYCCTLEIEGLGTYTLNKN